MYQLPVRPFRSQARTRFGPSVFRCPVDNELVTRAAADSQIVTRYSYIMAIDTTISHLSLLILQSAVHGMAAAQPQAPIQ